MTLDKEAIDYKSERERDVNIILDSTHPRKVVVAGAGTGKSYLFQKAIERERASGKTNFLAITFIGKLGDALADDLAGLAETMTLHGFARQFVLGNNPKEWEYYPKITELIKEDLTLKGIRTFKIGDAEYERRTNYYKTIGHSDVLHYAVQICKKDEQKIPKYDLILVDEFQDFDEIESEFINILSKKNKVLIVGDDDQALYEFKGSSPRFIREKFSQTNEEFESHTLRFCSRCTEVIINAFHDIVKKFNLDSEGSSRIKKEYICYKPEKSKDSDLNQRLIVLKDVAPGLIPVKIVDALKTMLISQKIKEVLVIGEGRTCWKLLDTTAKKFMNMGFKNVNYNYNNNGAFSFKENIIDGYKTLVKGENFPLAWRLLISEMKNNKKKKIILSNYDSSEDFINALPSEFKNPHLKNSEVLDKILNRPKSVIDTIAKSSIDKLTKAIVVDKKQDREILTSQLISENKNLPRPLVNLDITVCNILGSKGLGADVVFLIGFDQGKLPMKQKVQESEVYQMLVALTRAKKRVYFINTLGSQMSHFLNYIDKGLYTLI